MGLLALTEISANVAKPTTEPVVKKAAAENAAKKKPLVYGEAPVRRLHTKKEANVLVRDAAMHEWLRKRLPKNAAPRPRMLYQVPPRDAAEVLRVDRPRRIGPHRLRGPSSP